MNDGEAGFSHSKQPSLNRAGDSQNSGVVLRFEAAWQEMLDQVAALEIDSFLEQDAADADLDLKPLLKEIRSRYCRLIMQRAEERTADNRLDATVIKPADRAPEDAVETATPGGALDKGSNGGSDKDSGFDALAATGSYLAGSEEFELAPDAPPPEFAATVIGQGPTDDAKTGRAKQPRPNVPGYELLGELGRGGMGVVYLARQQGLNRLVALKMILSGGLADSEQVLRFQAEAEAVAHLQHPNIVQIHEINQAKGLPYFSLEFVDGHSLEKERDGQPMTPARAAALVQTLADTMHYAHERGIVHRDLKPANVLLTKAGVPKITDFGLVKRLEEDSGQTRTGMVMGTPTYVSPEQSWGGDDIGPPTDIYAMGVILYVLLTGHPPFSGPSAMETLVLLRDQEPVPPSRVQPGIPRDLETICLKCLQKDPAKRYLTAGDFAEDLRRFQAGEPILARPVGRLERGWRWCRRNRSLASALAVALLLGVSLMIGGPTAAVMINAEKKQALEAQGLAETNEVLANENAENWKLAETRARDNAQIAGEQRNLAVTALETLIERVPTDLKNVPNTERIKRSLLLTAMNGINQVADTGPKAKRDFLMAKAHAKMGESLMEIGEAKQAQEQFQRSHAILLDLAKTDTEVAPSRHTLRLGRSYRNLGKAAEKLSGPKAAKELYLRSLEARKEGLPLAEDPLSVLQEVAETCGHLNRIALALGRPREAMTYLTESAAYRDEWLRKAPRNESALREQAGLRNSLGHGQLALGEPDQSINHYLAAIKILAELASETDPKFNDRGNLAACYTHVGNAHLLAGRPEQAVEYYPSAVERLEEQVALNQRNVQLKGNLALAYYCWGVACRDLNDPMADEHLKRSVELRRQLAKPEDVGSQQALMVSLARLGRTSEAALIGETLLKKFPDDPSVLFHVACGFALCGAAASNAGTLGPNYLDQAVKTLDEAVERGYEGIALLKIDPDLAPIREHDGFQKLLARLANPPAIAER